MSSQACVGSTASNFALFSAATCVLAPASTVLLAGLLFGRHGWLSLAFLFAFLRWTAVSGLLAGAVIGLVAHGANASESSQPSHDSMLSLLGAAGGAVVGAIGGLGIGAPWSGELLLFTGSGALVGGIQTAWFARRYARAIENGDHPRRLHAIGALRACALGPAAFCVCITLGLMLFAG